MIWPDDFVDRIILGDCGELLDSIPADGVDIVITDPPYGMSYLSNHYKGENPHKAIAGDEAFPTDIVIRAISKASKAAFVFCRWDNLPDIPKPKSFIVWHKNNWTAGDLKHEYGRMWEGIAFYPGKNHVFRSRLPDIIKIDRVPPTELLHPTQKPVDLIRALLYNNSIEGDLVLDPYCGSGTTCVAAKLMGRRYIGIDLEPKYVATANARLGEIGHQGELF